MAVVINTNVDSLKIQNILSNSTNKLSQTMERMSTGLKVNSAKDDAAGTVISARMAVQLDGNQICQKNVQNANAMMSTAEGNLDVIESNLTRIRDLTLQAMNGTYSDNEIKAMDDEVKSRIEEIDRISNSAKYSDLSLFNDTNGLQAHGVSFQVGANSSSDDVISLENTLFQSVDFNALTQLGKDFSLVTAKKAEAADAETETPGATTEPETPPADTDTDTEPAALTDDVEVTDDAADDKKAGLAGALDALDKGIKDITDRKSIVGSVQNRLESALSTLTTQYTNLSSAKSIITDADIAAEASSYTQAQILQQVSTSLLAQANQAPSVALSLI